MKETWLYLGADLLQLVTGQGFNRIITKNLQSKAPRNESPIFSFFSYFLITLIEPLIFVALHIYGNVWKNIAWTRKFVLEERIKIPFLLRTAFISAKNCVTKF